MSLRNLPSVDRLLNVGSALVSAYGRPLTLHALRIVLEEIRTEITFGTETPSHQIIISRAEKQLSNWTKPTLQPVINATGVVLHTNLGRAPLSGMAIRAMDEIARGYSNLEFDLETGKRGSRQVHVEAVLRNLTGAEAGLVVNNCASAVLLVLAALANRKQVIIPRSQLVEIGGGFRIPDVMKLSGARLVEIGTTNKVRLSDFELALDNQSSAHSLVMHIHRSNFKIIGFTEEPDLNSIINFTHSKGAIFIDDLGSGALIDTARFGMDHEPTIQESLASGADIILFSGDKLLGGPQSGIILGKKDLIAKIKRHPLARAVRADKTCLAGLNATLIHYLKDEAESEIPLWRMISIPLDSVRQRAENWQREIGAGELVTSESTVGGGTLPGESFPTWVLSFQVKSPDKFLARLRNSNPAVIARTQNNRILFDPRTVLPEQDTLLIECLKALLF
ncbi:MAG: L-seryl-tRNA(Sec) selenium transferase [Chloroflexi bacterium]|nr:L-seryl-tRNA(Sec) selenium transferase [Chloroflexota bacterium]